MTDPKQSEDKKPDTPLDARLLAIRDFLAKIEAHTNPTREQGQKKDEKDRTQKKDEKVPSVVGGLKNVTASLSGLIHARGIFDGFANLKGLHQSTVQVVGAVQKLMAGLPPKDTAKSGGDEQQSTKKTTNQDTKKSSTTDSTTATNTSSTSVAQRVLTVTAQVVKLTSAQVRRSAAHSESSSDQKSSSESLAQRVASTSTDLTKLSQTNTVNAQTTSTNTTSSTSSATQTGEQRSAESLVQRVSRTTSDILKRVVQREGGAAGRAGGSAANAAGGATGSAARAAAGAAGSGGSVGGAGAAVAGGEAAGGALGGVGGGAARALAPLVANPVGAVIAAVVAVAAAMVILPPLIKKWGESLLEGQRHLAESSGGMAAVFAKKDVADTMREQRIGDATAGSAGRLSDSLIRLEDKFEPFMILISDFLNNVMAGFVDLASGMFQTVIDQINMVIRGINAMIPFGDPLKEIAVNTRPKNEQTDFGNFLNDWARAGTAYRGGPAHGASGPPVRGLGAPVI